MKCPHHLACRHDCEGVCLVVDWHRRFQPTLGSVALGQVVLGDLRKGTAREPGSSQDVVFLCGLGCSFCLQPPALASLNYGLCVQASGSWNTPFLLPSWFWSSREQRSKLIWSVSIYIIYMYVDRFVSIYLYYISMLYIERLTFFFKERSHCTHLLLLKCSSTNESDFSKIFCLE